MIEVHNISKRFGGNVAVDGVSFQLFPGQMTAMIGPNGAGKTTILDIVAGFLAPDEGTVKLDGRDTSRESVWRRAKGYLARTFQHTMLTSTLSAKENVQLHFRNQRGTSLFSAVFLRSWWRQQERDLGERAHDLLRDLGMQHVSRQRGAELSFGEGKCITLAGAVAHDGRVVLVDEPFSGLDMMATKRASAILQALADKGKYVLFVEHNLRAVASIAQRVLALDRGRLIADGQPQQVLSSDVLMKAFTR